MNGADSSPTPAVSIIVPCFNEAEAIEEKVRDCRKAGGPELEVEVIVVDDHSTDGTAERAAAAGARVVASEGPRGKWPAITTGVGEAAADIVCITDADVLFEEGALSSALEPFDDTEVGAVSGLRRMGRRQEDGTWVARDGLYNTVRMLLMRFYSFLDSTPAFCGPMMLVRRELLARIDGGRLRADDVTIPVQIRKLGYRAKMCARASFRELELPRGTRESQARRRALGLVQAYWHHREALGDPRLGVFGLVAYPMEFAFFFLAPFVVLAACVAAAAAAALGSRVALLACGLLALEEAVTRLRGSASVLAQVAQMVHAILSFARHPASVEGAWQPPRGGEPPA